MRYHRENGDQCILKMITSTGWNRCMIRHAKPKNKSGFSAWFRVDYPPDTMISCGWIKDEE